MPSSSARCSQLPRAVDKVPFYAALKRLRDHLHGKIPHLDDSEVCFPDLELKVIPKSERDADGNPIKKEPAEPKLDKDGKPVVKKEPGTKKSPAKKTPPAKKAPRKRKSTGKTPEHPMPENGQQPQQQQQQVPPQQIVIAPEAAANGGMMPYPGPHPPTTAASNNQQQPAVSEGSGLEGLFGSGASNLVKQEDLSELAQFGIGPGSFGPQFNSPPQGHGGPPPAHGGPPFHRPGFPSSVHVQDPFADPSQNRPPMMIPHVTAPATTHAPMHPYWSFPQQYPAQPSTTSPMPAHQHPAHFSSPQFSSPQPPFTSPNSVNPQQTNTSPMPAHTHPNYTTSPFSSPQGVMPQPQFSSPSSTHNSPVPAHQQTPNVSSTPFSSPQSTPNTTAQSTASTPTTSQ